MVWTMCVVKFVSSPRFLPPDAPNAAATDRQTHPALTQWTDTYGAGEILRRSRSRVYQMAEVGRIHRYYVGSTPLFLIEELKQVRAAMDVLERGKPDRRRKP